MCEQQRPNDKILGTQEDLSVRSSRFTVLTGVAACASAFDTKTIYQEQYRSHY